MRNERIGNDISIAWTINSDEAPFSLEGKDITLYLHNPYGKEKVEGYSVKGNVLSWTFLGKNQKVTGKYSLILVVNEGARGMITTDSCDFVNLVPCSCQIGGEDNDGVQTEVIELTSEVSIGGYDDTEIRQELTNVNATALEAHELATLANERIDAIEIEVPEVDLSEINQSLDKIESELTELSARVDNLEEGCLHRATYGVDTYDEVKALWEAGKYVICSYNGIDYLLSIVYETQIFFNAVNGYTSYRVFVNSNNVWGQQSYQLEQTSNKVTSLSDKSTDTQYPSAKAVYDAIEAVKEKEKEKEKDYELLLNTTIEEDVESFSVIDRVPNILDYKDLIILMEFKYQEGVNRQGYISFYNSNASYNAVQIERVASASYLTHYIIRIHRGKGWDKTAYIESHTNSFNNPAYDEIHKGLNCFCASEIDNIFTNTMVLNFPFYTGERIKIYGK